MPKTIQDIVYNKDKQFPKNLGYCMGYPARSSIYNPNPSSSFQGVSDDVKRINRLLNTSNEFSIPSNVKHGDVLFVYSVYYDTWFSGVAQGGPTPTGLPYKSKEHPTDKNATFFAKKASFVVTPEIQSSRQAYKAKQS